MSADKATCAALRNNQAVVCVAVRDDSDEIVALMLSQLLRRAGHSAKAIPLENVDRALAEVFDARPEWFVCRLCHPTPCPMRGRCMRGCGLASQTLISSLGSGITLGI